MKYLRSVRLLFVAAGLLLAASCSTDRALAPAPEQSSVQTGNIDATLLGDLLGRLHLLQCRPLPYSVTTARIGPSGGSMSIGPHTLVIPRGALEERVRITAEVISDDVNSIRFSPHGLEFERRAVLTMSYANCNVAGIWLPRQIVYTTEGLDILELIPSLDDVFHKRTTGRIDHFSRYAVGW